MATPTFNQNGVQLGVGEFVGDRVAAAAAHVVAFAVQAGDKFYRALNPDLERTEPDTQALDYVAPIGGSLINVLAYMPRIISSELTVGARALEVRAEKIGTAVIRELDMLKKVLTDKPS